MLRDLEKTKLSEIEKIFESMEIPHDQFDEDAVKKDGRLTYRIANSGKGYIEYSVKDAHVLVFFRCDGSGDYEFNEKFVEDDRKVI